MNHYHIFHHTINSLQMRDNTQVMADSYILEEGVFHFYKETEKILSVPKEHVFYIDKFYPIGL